jgi:hypothetical protein
MWALLYGQKSFQSLFGELKGSFRQSFVEVVDEARASGVMELTRQADSSAAHFRARAHGELGAAGPPLDRWLESCGGGHALIFFDSFLLPRGMKRCKKPYSHL